MYRQITVVRSFQEIIPNIDEIYSLVVQFYRTGPKYIPTFLNRVSSSAGNSHDLRNVGEGVQRRRDRSEQIGNAAQNSGESGEVTRSGRAKVRSDAEQPRSPRADGSARGKAKSEAADHG